NAIAVMKPDWRVISGVVAGNFFFLMSGYRVHNQVENRPRMTSLERNALPVRRPCRRKIRVGGDFGQAFCTARGDKAARAQVCDEDVRIIGTVLLRPVV